MPLINRVGSVSKAQVSTGVDINGIIEQYKVAAGENISAGDFVEFMKNSSGTTAEITTDSTKLLTYIVSNTLTFTEFILLDEDTVFMLYSWGAVAGLVIKIENGVITPGIPTSFFPTSAVYHTNYYTGQVIQIDTDTLFVLHPGDEVSSTTNYYLYGTFVTINGTTITIGTSTQLSTEVYSGRNNASLTRINNSEYLVTFGSQASNCKQGMVLTINNGIVTAGTPVILSSTVTYASSNISPAVLFDTNKLFAILNGSSYHPLWGLIITIENGLISPDLPVRLTEADGTNSAGTCLKRVVMVDKDNFFILHSWLGSNILCGLLVNIENGVITSGVDTQLSNETYASSQLQNGQALFIDADTMFVLYCGDSAGQTIYCNIVNIEGGILTAGNPMQISTVSLSNMGMRVMNAILIDEDKVLVGFNTGQYYAIVDIVKPDMLVKSYVSIINGIAKTSGSSEEIIDVYVPN
ncbi:hypothetical protein LJC10_05475 [Selenomonadales bacterium OttesenSCG-928-I06]|nr:hypothetical protein [Selenomonadales bacterium OttesenSCG-928-I06]